MQNAPLSRIHIFLRKGLRQVLFECLRILSYVNFCSHVRIFVRKDLRGVVTPNKTTSRHKIVVFKMASINKHHLIAVALVILKKRRRRKNIKKKKKKKIWVKKMNKK